MGPKEPLTARSVTCVRLFECVCVCGGGGGGGGVGVFESLGSQ